MMMGMTIAKVLTVEVTLTILSTMTFLLMLVCSYDTKTNEFLQANAVTLL